MKRRQALRCRLWSTVALGLFSAAAAAQQASISLKSSDLSFCNKQDTQWTITKSADKSSVVSGSTVNWTVTATRNADGAPPPTICAAGYVDVTNTGSAPATIGNIVVNLQRSRPVSGKNRWVSAAANVADATAGDAATRANIVANASQEDPNWNGAWNSPPTYAVSSARGTFTENAASGALSFTDADSNTVFSIVPQAAIAAGQTVRLLFDATFNNAALRIPEGESLRTEVIVTFGNAGARGGSGASASNIDINGNNAIDAAEANVRSVPTRLTRSLPGLEICNDTVALGDELSFTGTAAATPVAGFLPASTSASGSWVLTAVLTGSGNATNTASLKGSDSFTSVVIGSTTVTDPATGITTTVPVTAQVPCCEAADFAAASTVSVIETRTCDHGTNEDGSCKPPPACSSPRPDGTCRIVAGDFCTFTQGGWGANPNGQNPGRRLADAFPTAYPAGVTVGGTKTMKFTSSSAVATYLPAGGTPAALTASLVNPSSSSAGVFGGQVLALQLSVDLGNAGFLPAGLGSLKIGSDGLTVSGFLAQANAALGGSLPAGTTYSALNELATNLNEAFDNCNSVTGWAEANLKRP